VRGRLLPFGVEAIAMGSLLAELARREAAARERVEAVREQIERLREHLTAEEQALSRLVIARETVEEIVGEAAGLDEQVAAGIDDALVAARAGSGDGQAEAAVAGGSPIGVLGVPPWRPGLDSSVLPQAYRDVLEILVDAARPLRAGHLAAALGLGERSGAIEGAAVQAETAGGPRLAE
jgi:hypothetical protein